MKKRVCTIVGLIVSFVFWFSDSALNLYIYGEPEFEIIPNDINELWMRSVIVILVIVSGVLSDSYSRRLVFEEKQSEAINIYNSMLGASQHILNNLLNQMQIVKLEALKSKQFNQNIIREYDIAFNDAVELISKLSSVEKITSEDIEDSVYPK